MEGPNTARLKPAQVVKRSLISPDFMVLQGKWGSGVRPKHTSFAGAGREVFGVGEKGDRVNAHCLGEFFQDIHGRGILSALDHADIVAVDAGLIGQVFLRQTLFFADTADIGRDRLPK